MQLEILGNTESVSKKGNVLILKTKEAEARVWVYSQTIIRISISKEHGADTSFAVIQKPSKKLDYTESAEEIVVTTSALKLKITKSPLRFGFYTSDGKILSEDDARFGVNWQGARVINYRKLYPDEKFIGLGEKTGNLNRRAKSASCAAAFFSSIHQDM